MDITATKKPKQIQKVIETEVAKKNVSQDIRTKGEMKLSSNFVGVHNSSYCQQELDITATKKPKQIQEVIEKEVAKKNVSQDIRSKGEMKLNSKFVGVHNSSAANKETKTLITKV